MVEMVEVTVVRKEVLEISAVVPTQPTLSPLYTNTDS